MPHPLRTTTGQNQRTLKPEGPLIDEPERHLDATWTEFLASELRHLVNEENRCIVVASHSDTITQACDEVVQL